MLSACVHVCHSWVAWHQSSQCASCSQPIPAGPSLLQAYFAKWPDSGVVDLKKEFANLVAKTAARTLLGREVREQLFDQVGGTHAATTLAYYPSVWGGLMHLQRDSDQMAAVLPSQLATPSAELASAPQQHRAFRQ